jgi:L-fuculose-phosphate aldolase
MSEKAVRDLRERLCRIGKQLFDHGLVTSTFGNISARVQGTKTILIKATGASMGSLKPENLVLVSLEGKQLEGGQAKSVETPMHVAVYNARSDVNGVVHSHAPVATAFGIAGLGILPVTTETYMLIPNGVPIVPFEKPGTKKLATAVQRKIREFDAVILENHGILTVGHSIEEACNLNMTIEETARLQFMATLLAGKNAVTMKTLKKKYRT